MPISRTGGYTSGPAPQGTPPAPQAFMTKPVKSSETRACNCMYGTNDPRCCIARAQRRALEEAHRLGCEGKPLPPVEEPPATSWLTAINRGAK